ALRTAQPDLVWVRLFVTGMQTTQSTTPKTIQAWQTIYRDADPSILDSMNPPDFKVVAVEPWKVESIQEEKVNTKYSNALPNASEKTANKSETMADRNTGLPVVRGETWRAGNNIPWSTNVLVRDEFEGEYVAVFDKGSGIITNWNKQFVDVFLYDRSQGLVFGVNGFELALGSQRLKLTGSRNRVAMTDELAKALREAPLVEPVLTFTIQRPKKKPKTIQRTLDLETVQAWKSLYRESAAIEFPEVRLRILAQIL
ncbi:MAG: hypothetical protein WCD18_12845, partial [Thermosynechococcaceae cyanobacterium]